MMATAALCTHTHTLEANIILGSETQIYLLWTTNIFAQNYRYICSQLQICLLQTENQLAKLATVAQCTHTLKYLICYGLRHLRKSTKSGLMFYPPNTVTISFQYVALHTGSDPMQTLNLQLWSNTNTMPWIRRARHLALNMWRSMPDLIQCKLYSWLRALIKCHPSITDPHILLQSKERWSDIWQISQIDMIQTREVQVIFTFNSELAIIKEIRVTKI